MARDSTAVLIGTGTLYLAPLGTAFPVDPSVTPVAPWEDVGYSDEGWSFNVERNIEKVEVAEELEPVAILATGRSVHLVGAMAQATLENLKSALGGGTITAVVGPPAYRKFDPPSIESLTSLAALLRTNAPAGKRRDVQIPKVIASAAFEMASKKAPDKTLIESDFEAVKISGQNIFTILDQS